MRDLLSVPSCHHCGACGCTDCPALHAQLLEWAHWYQTSPEYAYTEEQAQQWLETMQPDPLPGVRQPEGLYEDEAAASSLLSGAAYEPDAASQAAAAQPLGDDIIFVGEQPEASSLQAGDSAAGGAPDSNGRADGAPEARPASQGRRAPPGACRALVGCCTAVFMASCFLAVAELRVWR